jgi:4-amino-4-deoxy-L-arabinose transferase-like glycosyltransferase
MKSTAALALILLAGLALRLYNLNFPAIGYHNMVENEYLSIAQEMQRSGDFLTKRVYFQNAFDKDPMVKSDPRPALVSYQTLFSWRLFGENLWAPRLFNILFGVLSILITYFIVLQLFGNKAQALFCAWLLAVMPLAVFFSRNIQPESPALFFMLLGNLCYLKFSSSLNKYQLFLGGLCFSLAWVYRSSFLIGALPFLFCLPYGRILARKEGLWKYALSLLFS